MRSVADMARNLSRRATVDRLDLTQDRIELEDDPMVGHVAHRGVEATKEADEGVRERPLVGPTLLCCRNPGDPTTRGGQVDHAIAEGPGRDDEVEARHPLGREQPPGFGCRQPRPPQLVSVCHEPLSKGRDHRGFRDEGFTDPPEDRAVSLEQLHDREHDPQQVEVEEASWAPRAVWQDHHAERTRLLTNGLAPKLDRRDRLELAGKDEAALIRLADGKRLPRRVTPRRLEASEEVGDAGTECVRRALRREGREVARQETSQRVLESPTHEELTRRGEPIAAQGQQIPCGARAPARAATRDPPRAPASLRPVPPCVEDSSALWGPALYDPAPIDLP